MERIESPSSLGRTPELPEYDHVLAPGISTKL